MILNCPHNRPAAEEMKGARAGVGGAGSRRGRISIATTTKQTIHFAQSHISLVFCMLDHLTSNQVNYVIEWYGQLPVL